MTHILLVEDNDLNLDMLSRRLTRRGYRVSTASDGSIGLELANKEHPDLILMDVGLPEMDGWEVTSRLKADSNTSDIPVIILTAHVTPEDRERSVRAGCDAYEPKPVDLSKLVAKIESLVRHD